MRSLPLTFDSSLVLLVWIACYVFSANSNRFNGLPASYEIYAPNFEPHCFIKDRLKLWHVVWMTTKRAFTWYKASFNVCWWLQASWQWWVFYNCVWFLYKNIKDKQRVKSKSPCNTEISMTQLLIKNDSLFFRVHIKYVIFLWNNFNNAIILNIHLKVSLVFFPN